MLAGMTGVDIINNTVKLLTLKPIAKGYLVKKFAIYKTTDVIPAPKKAAIRRAFPRTKMPMMAGNM